MDFSIAQTYADRKQGAFSFLKNLETTLNASLPVPEELRLRIRQTVKEAKAESARNTCGGRNPHF
jgi:hypothetical protein